MDPEQFRERAKAAGYSDEEIDAFLTKKAGGTARSLGRAAVQGLTLDFGDEILGALPEWIGGGKKARDEMRAADKAFSAAHPWVSGGARLAGGLALPGGVAVKAGMKGMRAVPAILQSAGIGAATGAAAGAGSGETTDERLDRGLVGGLLGAAGGAVVPSVVAGVRSFAPAARAADRLQAAIARSGGVQGLRKLLGEAVGAGRGEEVMLGDLGRPMQQATDFAANASEDAAERVGKVAYPRQENMANRVLDDVRQATGGPDASKIADDLAESRRGWADGPEGYGGLREQNPIIVPAMAESFQKLLHSPAIKGAWEQAREVGLIGPMERSGSVSFDVMQGALERVRTAKEGAFNRGVNDLAFRLKAAEKALADELEVAVPGYQKVAAEYRRRMQLEGALKAGEDAFTQQDTRGLREMLAGMTADEQGLFRQGIASKLIAQLRAAQTNRQVARQMVTRSKSMEDKLNIIFGGRAGFEAFIQKMQVESEMGHALGALGGSQTARRLAAQGADPADMVIAGVTGGPGSAAAIAARGLVPKVVAPATATRMGPTLTTQGAGSIEELLKQWERGGPRSLTGGAFPSRLIPAGLGALTPGLLGVPGVNEFPGRP